MKWTRSLPLDIIFSTLLALAAFGCGSIETAGDFQGVPTPVAEDELRQVAAAPNPVTEEPQPATDLEISGDDAVRLYNACREIVGFGDTYIPASELSISRGYSPPEACNVYALHGHNLSLWVRAFDARIVNMAVLGYPEGPGMHTDLSEEEARSICSYIWHELDRVENECIDPITGFPRQQRPSYAITGAKLENLGRWNVTFERASDTGIPYYGQAGTMSLQPDGSFYMLVLHEPDACHGTEPAVSEAEALAIARPLYEAQIARNDPCWQHMPESEFQFADSAELVYAASQGQRQNCLTWLVNKPETQFWWHIYVDAESGEITEWSFPR